MYAYKLIYTTAGAQAGRPATLRRLVHSLTQLNGENQLPVADGPVEFEEEPVEVQDFRKISHRFF